MRKPLLTFLCAAAMVAGLLPALHAMDEDIDAAPEEVYSEYDDVQEDGYWRRFGHDGSGRRYGPHAMRDGRPGPGRGRPGMDRGYHRSDHFRSSRHDGFGHGGMALRIIEQLDLSSDQKAQIIDSLTANFRRGLEARLELAEARSALRTVRWNDEATEQDIVDAHTAVGVAQGKLAAVMANGKKEIASLLNPEQREQLQELRRPSMPPERSMEQRPGYDHRRGDGRLDGRGGHRGPGGPRHR